jgi:hypothetical protein
VYCRSVRILPVVIGSILTLLQYTMTLLQGPKDPVLPTLTYIAGLARGCLKPLLFAAKLGLWPLSHLFGWPRGQGRPGPERSYC